MSHSTFRVGAPISPSYRYYSLAAPPLGFLRQLTWVDLRTQTLDLGTAILAKAARGEPPGPDLKEHLDVVRASICPYRGLFHFREEDAPFFFGREAVIDQLVDKV